MSERVSVAEGDGGCPVVVYKRGKIARGILDEEGRRKFVPFKVTLEVQMSELSVISEALVFYVYQETAQMAARVACNCFAKWYKTDKGKTVADWPKPAGIGTAEAVTDREFTYAWKQAEVAGQEVKKAGIPDDPVAFLVIEKSGKIITSASIPLR